MSDLKKFIATTIREFLNEQILNKKYNVSDVLSYSEMVDYILDNNLRNTGGKIDYNDAKYIAGASDKWILKMISLDSFDWYADSNYKNKSIKAYPIILEVGDNEYEVLDGKHRIGMYKDMNIKEMLMWVGK
jgi:hypothetical protein